MAREAGVTAGAVVVIGVGGGLAVALVVGLGAIGLGVAEGVEFATGCFEQAAAVAAASPAVPANCSSRRRVTSWPLSAFMNLTLSRPRPTSLECLSRKFNVVARTG